MLWLYEITWCTLSTDFLFLFLDHFVVSKLLESANSECNWNVLVIFNLKIVKYLYASDCSSCHIITNLHDSNYKIDYLPDYIPTCSVCMSFFRSGRKWRQEQSWHSAAECRCQYCVASHVHGGGWQRSQGEDCRRYDSARRSADDVTQICLRYAYMFCYANDVANDVDGE